MRKLLKPILTVFALLVMVAPSYAAGPVIGAPAPEFTLKDIDGNSHSLSDFKGKTVILEWTNHECPFVMKHYDTGNMQKLQAQATAMDDVVWLTIVSSAPGKQGYTTPEEAKMVIEKVGAKATARLLDPTGDVGKLYDAKTTPHMFVINDEGNVVYMGAIDDNPSPRHETVESAHNYVIPAIEAAKKHELPEMTQTKPYGCGVKYDIL